MTGKDLDDIEKSLARLAPKAIPPGLRQRVMASALDARENAGLTPRMWAVALVWAMLALVAVIGDAVVSKWQSGRIAALLGGPVVSKPAGEEARLLWAELDADLGDSINSAGRESPSPAWGAGTIPAGLFLKLEIG